MLDSTVWVAIITAGTAVLASWVTSHGNARAARIQAEAAARAQHHGHVREARRLAYLELIEHAHITGEFYFRLDDAYMQLTDPQEQLVRIQELRADLRDAFDPLARCVRVILLEGPNAVAEKAEAVKTAASDTNTALWKIAQGSPNARAHFDQAHHAYRQRLDHFIEAAREAHERPYRDHA